jgi:hypothetical protein
MKAILTTLFIFICMLGFSQVKRVSLSDNVKRTSIYPNPAKSFVHIQYKQGAQPPASLTIYSFLGKKQLETNQPGSHVFIDLASFNRGIYIFQFRDRNGQVIDSGKFQVEK